MIKLILNDMGRKILVSALTVFIFILILTSNIVSAENFTSLGNEINENDHVNLDSDIALNQNSSNEEITYDNGILIKDKEIHIEGNNHRISGKDSNDNHAKIFNIINSNVTLSNMEICFAQFNGPGGAISLDNTSSLILTNVTFKDNSAIGIYGEGGAIYSEGFLKIHDSKFESNYASGAGGAIYSFSSNCEIHSSEFINNCAKWYGGAVFSNYQLEADSCLFDQNNAYSGGVLHCALIKVIPDNPSFFNRVVFTRNTALFGGVFSTSSINKIIALNCNLTSNYASKGGVIYQNGKSVNYIQNCLVENNSAEFGAVIYDNSNGGSIYFNRIINTTLNDNYASEKSSIYYGREGNLFINQSIINNNANMPIFNGKGNITVLNSKISNFGEEFITQLLCGTIIVFNNTWGLDNANLEDVIDCGNNSHLITGGAYDETMLLANIGGLELQNNLEDLLDLDCCSVVLRINQTDFTISHRRDGGKSNFTLYLDKDEDFIREFKTISTYFSLSKVYTNGWIIGAGGWDDSGENEKIEAIASDMVKNENINLESLKLILEVKKTVHRGHLLIVAPDGTYGNVIVYDDQEFIKMDVLGDGDYIISPNAVDYRREGHLDKITDIVDSNIYLSANDWYGTNRHCIIVHHITLSENGFADDIYVTNDGGKFVNRHDSALCDNVWFKEEYLPSYKIPLTTAKIYVGGYYSQDKTIISQDIIRGYNSNYNYLVKLFNNDGEVLSGTKVKITINGKTSQYTTNNKGLITIPSVKLTTAQTIIVPNPINGKAVKNYSKVVPKLIGSIPNNLILEKYTLTVTFSDQSIKNTLKAKQTLKTNSKIIKKTSKNIVLKATLKTIKNKPIKNKKIIFKFRGQKYSAKTNKNGVAKVTIKNEIIKKLKIGEKYSFKVSYLKNTLISTVEVKG